MSADLTWMLLKNHSRYLVKRDGVQFSSDPHNLTKVNSFKFSGLANTSAVGVSVSQDGKRVELSMKRPARSSQPKLQCVTVPLNRATRAKGSHAAKTIRTLTTRSKYRADLADFAIARYHALRQSLTAKPAIKKTRRSRHKAQKPAAK